MKSPTDLAIDRHCARADRPLARIPAPDDAKLFLSSFSSIFGHVSDAKRVRSRGEHVFTRGAIVSGGVRDRSHQTRIHGDRDSNERGGGAGGGKTATSPLMDASSLEKIAEVDAHVGCAASRIGRPRGPWWNTDAECQNHYFTYNEPMPVLSCTTSLCELAMSFAGDGEKRMSRPLGWRCWWRKRRGRVSSRAHGSERDGGVV